MDAIIELLSTFGVNWTYFLGHTITFLALLTILRLTLYGPMLAMLDARKQRIAQGLKDADEARRAREAATSEANAAVKEAAARAEQIIQEANQAADRLKQELIGNVQGELQALRTQQSRELEQARVKMLQDVKQEVVSLVVATTTKVLRSTMTDADRERIAKHALKELAS
jgi:F-type H+-transporting ATPase subunit b